ncbi:lysophospholipid acyltransferase family protein [Telmatospirillum sp.]|uniref:lysophospholipid acyltransferase family protein n=1 Tax=Telmatospirillum sp. TaxID=2079197 RepID=UPI00284CE85A|nr:lysophospholipid acyltransferase family protein [Telmatospirillum sp.]MDR3439078.1 lysophospholipid acyltransferase family protein [Telmatospirillum sp.]
MHRIDYWWRLAGTGVAFAFIFFGGGVLAVTLLPLLALVPGAHRHRTQFVIHLFFRGYLRALQCLRIIRIDVEGIAKLATPGGRLVVANHPSLLDVVMLMALIPRAQCIVKHELWNHRFLGHLMRRAGYIRNDLNADDLIAACQASLQAGDSLIIFPEGTRSRPGHPPQFHRGFANLATLTGVPIQLVVITCTPPTLIKGEPWWRIPSERPIFRLVIDECLDADQYMRYRYRSLAARNLTRSLETYYAEKLGNA